MNADEMIAHARAVRARLRRPPNAVTLASSEFQPRRIPHLLKIEPITSPYIAMDITAAFVAGKFNIGIKDLHGRSKHAPSPLARHFLGYLAAKHLGFPLHRIGAYLGQTDHTTVWFGKNRIVRRLLHASASDPLWKMEIEYRDLYVPAFALPNLGKPHLEGGRSPRLSQQGIHGVEG